MNVYRAFKTVVEASLHALSRRGALPLEIDMGPITVEPPRDPSHGDIATNAALCLARPASKPPREIAALIAAELERYSSIARVNVAGPGFINLDLTVEFWQERLGEILEEGRNYGSSDIGQGRRVNVEFVSANPTGPLHVGHARGAVFGDALAALLAKVGYEVTREYYVNNAGAQMQAFADSIHHRYRETLGDSVGDIPQGLYPGEYLVSVAEEIVRGDGDKWLGAAPDAYREAFGRFGYTRMMADIQADLRSLAVDHDYFALETMLHEGNGVADAVRILEHGGHIYQGVLEPPKGKTDEDWEPRPQMLFRSRAFGDDVDRPLQKSDGSWTYFATDAAYHLDKIQRGFSELINVWGADHGGYVKRMKSAVKAFEAEAVTLDVKLCQLVRVTRAGVPVKMSKRAGTFVTLREVLDEVGKDVLRFIMLTRKNDAPLDFDLAKVMEQSKDNPVFYVQYAHARACSALRNAEAAFPDMDFGRTSLIRADASRLTDPGELALIKNLAGWPQQMVSAAQAREPHRLAFYLSTLAAEFHGQWNKGNEDPQLRFIVADDPTLSQARLALVRAFGVVVAAGLEIFGVEPVTEMR